MKILVISHMYISTFDKVSLFTHQQVKAITRRGHKIKVIAPVPWVPPLLKYYSPKWRGYVNTPTKMIWNNIEVYYPRYLVFPKGLFPASSGKRMYYTIKKKVAEIHKKFNFDIIHAHVALPDGYTGMKLAKKYNKPLVVTVHGKDFQQSIYKNQQCKNNIKKVIKFSSKTIVVSKKLKNIGEKKLNIPPNKLITVPNGINLNNITYSINRNNSLKQYKNKKVILSIANLKKTKGIDLNLKAIAKLKKKYKDLIYLIIGGGEEKENLKNLVHQLNIKDRVEFLGRLPHKRAMKYLPICNIFSLPSWEEGFGITYLEAAAFAKPVIACRKQGIDGVLKNKKTGLFVQSKNVNALIEIIDFLLSNPQKAKKIGEKAQKKVFESYTWDNIVPKITSIYNDILNKS